MNEEYKIIALDIDGTSVNSEGYVTDNTLSSIKYMVENGIEIIPCTGRMLSAIPKEIMNLGVKFAITANGANIIDVINNKIIYSELINYIVCSNAIYTMKKYETIVYVHNNGEAIFDKNNIERYSEVRPNKRRQMKIVENLENYIYENKMNVEKIGVLNLNREVPIPKDDIGSVKISSTDECTLEIISRNTSKGDALEWLLKRKGISFGEVIAFGDNENDLEMIERSGLSIAMGNASQSIKNIASFITKDNDNDGIAYAIDNLFNN